MKYNTIKQFAAQYDCGAYGASTYNNGQVCGTSTTPANTGPLSNTGLDVITPLAGGALLMVAAVVLFVRNARRSKAAASHQ